jgi:hypothetical protein
MLIVLKFVTKNVFFYEFDNETELLIYRSLQIEIKYQTFLYLMSDKTELENVNCIEICDEKFYFFYEFDNETELLIYRSLQIEIKYQRFLYLMSHETELENVNSINICYDFFLCSHDN